MPVAEVALLGASIVGITLSWRGSDWHPFGLWLLLLAIALLSDLLAIRVASNARISASFIAIVLAMALLGPAPAAALGVATTLTDFVYRGSNNQAMLSDLAGWLAFPLIGGLVVRWRASRRARASTSACSSSACSPHELPQLRASSFGPRA